MIEHLPTFIAGKEMVNTDRKALTERVARSKIVIDDARKSAKR
jgi:hypothetical protein